MKHNVIILSDEVSNPSAYFKPEKLILLNQVYDRLFYVPFTRVATISPEIARLTLTVGSAGKCFYATGWRVGWLIGPEELIRYVSAAHTRICFSSVSPLQEAAAVGFEQADKVGFWEESRTEMKGKVDRFCEIFDELGLPARALFPDGKIVLTAHSIPPPKAAISSSPTCRKSAYLWIISTHPT